MYGKFQQGAISDSKEALLITSQASECMIPDGGFTLMDEQAPMLLDTLLPRDTSI